MRVLKVFGMLALLVLASAALAQDATERAGSDLQQQLQDLDQGTAAMRTLNTRIASVAEEDREALLFRRDERGFRLLLDLDKLVRQVADLPADDPIRVEVDKRLTQDLAGAGDAVFRLLADVGQRISTYSAQLESLSGSSLVATEAYINSLELLRIQYFEGLIDIIEGRALLGVAADDAQAKLTDALYLQAETLAGHLEFSGAALDEVKGRLELDPTNADLDATLKSMGNQHQLHLQKQPRSPSSSWRFRGQHP